MTHTTDRELDPEMVCTRVMARLIEDIGCVAIAPDSPAWSDLGNEGKARAGELRVYRGRGRVQKIVSSCLQRTPSTHDAHSLVVLTQPSSPVPHLVIDIARRDDRALVHVDLLPKRDLAVSPEYVTLCYEPLSAARSQVDEDTHFAVERLGLRQRAMVSPWGVLFSLEPRFLASAQGVVERYLSHWAQLLRSTSEELVDDLSLTTRDLTHRRLLFSRAADPNWGRLERDIGTPSVDRILAQLTG